MRLRHVQTLLWISEAGSIRSAAERLGKSQSTLSKRLKQMEDEIGFQLFRRTSRGIVITKKGLSLLTRARSIKAELMRLEQEVSELQGLNSGSLRLSVAPLAAVKILPRAILRFRTFYPDIELVVSSDMFGDAINALREGRHDIVIGPHSATQAKGDIVGEELYTTEIVVITSRNAPHANVRSLKDLVNCYWTMLGDSTGPPKKRFQEQFSRHGLSPPRIRLASESRLGLLSLVEELGAVCTFPARLLDEVSASYNITRIPVREELNPLTISMVCRGGKSLTPAGEKLADCIRHRAVIVGRRWTETNVQRL